jgi:hypothetical protein
VHEEVGETSIATPGGEHGDGQETETISKGLGYPTTRTPRADIGLRTGQCIQSVDTSPTTFKSYSDVDDRTNSKKIQPDITHPQSAPYRSTSSS